MKKLIFLFAAVTFLVASCSKDEPGLTGVFSRSGQDNGLNTLCTGNNKVFIMPLPTDGDDKTNLLNTISLAAAAGPGSVVQLQKGTYHLGFVQIYDFNGSINGAGPGQTIIKPVPNLPCLAQASITGDISLITFVGGDVRLSDLSVRVDDGDACSKDFIDSYGGRDLYVMVNFTDRLHEIYSPANPFVRAHVENVDFSSGFSEGGTGEKYSVCGAIWFGFDFREPHIEEARTNGDLTVENCKFENVWTAVDVPGMGSGHVIIRNNAFKNLYAPIFIYDNINLSGTFMANRFSGSIYYDILVDDTDSSPYGYYPYEVPRLRSTYNIQDNILNTKLIGTSFIYPAGVSMYLMDMRRSFHPDENMPMRFCVKNNLMNLSEGSTGIFGLNNSDALIVANKLCGSGKIGITFDGTPAGSDPVTPAIIASHIKILGNNFGGSDFSVANVILGENTKNSIVTGEGKDNIIDNGTNNIVSGMRFLPNHHYSLPLVGSNNGFPKVRGH